MLRAHSRTLGGLLNRVRNARGYHSVVGLAVSPAFEGRGTSVQKCAKTGNSRRGKGKNMKGREEEHQRARASQKSHHVSSFVNLAGFPGWDCPCHGNSSHALGCSGLVWAGMFIEVNMSLGFTSFLKASLLSDRFSGFGTWDSGATTSMCGFQGIEAIRDSQLTSGMKDSFEIDITPEKQISCTFADGESQTSNSRVTFSMSVTSEISVSLHFSWFWTSSTDTLWSGCCASSGRDTRCHERQSLLATTSGALAASHQACGLSDRQGPLYLIPRHCLPFLTATDAQAMSL